MRGSYAPATRPPQDHKTTSTNRPRNTDDNTLLRHSDDACGGAVIRDVGLRAAGAPVVVIGLERRVERRVALIPIAQAAATRALAAAVVIRHYVVASVSRIVAGADPRHRRLLGPRRAGVLRTPAAPAQISVDRTVTPVLAARGILRIVRFRSTGARAGARARRLRTPCHRQQRQHSSPPEQQCPQRSQKPTPGSVPRHRSRGALRQGIQPSHSLHPRAMTTE